MAAVLLPIHRKNTMKPFVIALLALSALGAAQAQSSGLKAGLWESRTTRMTVDGKDMMPQIAAAAEQMKKQLASLPPEQRKKVEASLLAHGSDPTAQHLCISPEMAKRDEPILPRPRGAECDTPKLDRSGNRSTFEFVCKQGGGSMTAKGDTVAEGDLVTTKMDTTGKDAAGKAHTMQVETQMKFLGSQCGKVKPFDQLAHAAQAQPAAKAPAAPRAPAK